MAGRRKLQGTIRKADGCVEYQSDERCYVRELSSVPEEAELSIAEARVAPGIVTAWHHLNGITERYVITSGTAQVEVGDEPPAGVSAGDVITILPGVRQRITNSGDQDLTFLCICTPRFEWRYYQRLEP